MGLSAFIAAVVAVIELDVPKETLELGKHKDAAITIKSAAPLSVWSTLGRPSSRRGEAYLLSLEKVRRPQFVLVAAVGRDASEFAYAVIRVSGRGDAVVTTKPRMSVSVRVATEVYGPVVADNNGRAVVPVLVPPGVYEGALGNKALDLGLDRRSALLVALANDILISDAERQLPFLIFAVDGTGRMNASKPSLRPSVGRTSALVAVSPGIWRGTWTLPAGSAGDVRLEASIGGAEPGTGAASLSAVTGAPVRLELSCPARARAGEGITVKLSAFDAAGNPSWAPVTLSTTDTRLVAETREVSVQLPKQSGRVEIRAQTESASTTCALDLDAGPAASIELVAHGSNLRLLARDARGNTTSLPARAEVSASVGRVRVDGEIVNHEPLVEEIDSDVTITATAGELRTERRIVVAAPQRRWFLQPSVGLASNFQTLTSPFFALAAGHQLSLGGQRFFAAASVDYALRAQAAYGREDFISVSARIGYRPRLARRFSGEIALAAGAAVIINDAGNGTVEQGAAHVLELLLGSQVPLWQGGPSLGLRVRWQGDPRMVTVTGHLIALVADVGYRFEL